MPRLRIPLFGSYTNRNVDPAAFSSSDQQFVNGYPEIISNALTRDTKVQFNKRPGHTTSSSLASVSAAASVGMVLSWTGNSSLAPPPAVAFKNVGDSSTSVWNMSNASKIGADIADTSDCFALTETVVSTTANIVGNFVDSSSSAAEQWVFPEGGAWAQVTDGDFPTNIVGFPVHMDGYTFNMTQDGKIYNSDLNSVTAYTATNFISANLYPDKGVTVARHGRYIVAFGEKSIEFFVNAGHPFGSPLTKVEGGLQVGAARRQMQTHHTVLQALGTVYWIGTNSEGATTGVYRFKGNEPEKVSNPGIDKLLSSGNIAGFVGTMCLHGLNHVVMQGEGAGVWCFCAESNFWWKLTLASGEVRACLGVNDASFGGGATTYFVTGTSKKVHHFSTTTSPVYQDDGAAYTMTVQTDNIDAGTDRIKFWKRLRIICDRQTSGTIGVAWSDDDFGNFTTAVNVEITNGFALASRLGSSRRRSWKLTHSANTPCRIEAVEIEYELGSH